jgi:IgA Peptidase M64
MRLRTLALALGLLLPVLPAISATPPKAGSTCTKLGLTQNYSGKKFTCIKSGKKLIWDKGTTIKVASPKTSPSPTSTATQKISSDLSLDKRITSKDSLSPIDSCKTIDIGESKIGQRFSTSNGFPRPEGALFEKSEARILLIPVSFQFAPFRWKLSMNNSNQTTDLELLKQEIKIMEEGLETLSGGRFRLKVDLLPESKWWNISYPSPFKKIANFDNLAELSRIIDARSDEISFDEYDTYFFLTSNMAVPYGSEEIATASIGIPLKRAKSGFANLALMTGPMSSRNIMVHELGHSLFGLEDLYIYSGETNFSSASTPSAWDLMGMYNKLDLLNWNRFLIGWTRAGEVRCLLNQVNSIHFLTTFERQNQPKLLLINIAPGVTLAAEAKKVGTNQGLLTYVVNTYINSGQGPISANSNLLEIGKSRNILGWEFTVLDSNSEGLLVEVKKTDIDKFVPPETKKENSQVEALKSPIEVQGEITVTGSTTAKSKWSVSGQQSYRIYVTANDDFQKVYFESGIINSAVNNIEVDISGLVCNKELRVSALFYTLQSGKGETVYFDKKIGPLNC